MLKLRFSEYIHEAGVDEAGRGCLAGPVVAAAVILPDGFEHPLLNDSKKLSEKQRDLLKPMIEENALSYAVAYVYQQEIDTINILNASILAMHRALDGLKQKPEFIAVDGNKFKPYPEVPHQTVIKGDARFMNIAAASVLAKTNRDTYMKKIHRDFPYYNWKKNKGYPTSEHRKAIAKYGNCVHHRKSFTLLPAQLKLDL